MNLKVTKSIGLRQICSIELGKFGWGYTVEKEEYRNSVGFWFVWKLGWIHLSGWDHKAEQDWMKSK